MTPEQAARLAAMSDTELDALLMQATATAPAASNSGGEGLTSPLSPQQRKREGQIKGGVTTWNLYRRRPPGRKKLPRIDRKEEAGLPRGNGRRGARPVGSRSGTTKPEGRNPSGFLTTP